MGGFEEALGNWSELDGAENRTRYGVLALAGTGLLSPGPPGGGPLSASFLCVQLALRVSSSQFPSYRAAPDSTGWALAASCSSSLTLARLMIGALFWDQRDYVLASRFGSMAALRQRGQVAFWDVPGTWGGSFFTPGPGPPHLPLQSMPRCICHCDGETDFMCRLLPRFGRQFRLKCDGHSSH